MSREERRRLRCAFCGLPYHRYCTHDPEHDHDPMGCVNALWGRIERLERVLELAVELDTELGAQHINFGTHKNLERAWAPLREYLQALDQEAPMPDLNDLDSELSLAQQQLTDLRHQADVVRATIRRVRQMIARIQTPQMELWEEKS